MARTKRRMAKAPRARRPKADWVFRPNIADDAGNVIDAVGSYTPELSKTIVQTFTGAIGLVLYDSQNRIKDVVAQGFIPALFPRAARAEGHRARILRVVGLLAFTPSVWALGSSYFLGIRFGMFEQNSGTGQVVVPTNYHMWGNGSVAPDQTAARYANDGLWQVERRTIVRFNDNNSTLNVPFAFRVNRSLRPDQCYAVYIETASGSVNVTCNPTLRTLVSDEG